jgi:hypothetical protein
MTRHDIGSLTGMTVTKGNNKYSPDYDESKLSSYLTYLDANNLYDWSMIQDLPINNFKWSEERDIATLIKKGSCFVKMDLEYPKELHGLHNDYPLAPERKLVSSNKGVMVAAAAS